MSIEVDIATNWRDLATMGLCMGIPTETLKRWQDMRLSNNKRFRLALVDTEDPCGGEYEAIDMWPVAKSGNWRKG